MTDVIHTLYDPAVACTPIFSGDVSVSGVGYRLQRSGAPGQPRALYFNAAGTVKLQLVDGSTTSFVVVAGQLLPVRCVGIQSSTITDPSTTVAGIIVLW